MARLALVLTARFNWRSGTFAVGQRELARMWNVTERTAKREMAQMRALGWVRVARQAARGRVAEHSVVIEVLLAATRPYWAAVGPDYEDRMTGSDAPSEAPTNVVPLRPVPTPEGEGPWAAMAARLSAEDPALFAAWFAALQPEEDGAALTLHAPTRFLADYVMTHHHRHLLRAARAAGVQEVRVVSVE